MNELQKKLKELVKKGELAQEEFDEIAQKMEFVEEPQEPAEPAPEEPQNEPAPAEEPVMEEKVEEKVEEAEPAPAPAQDENVEPEVKPEMPEPESQEPMNPEQPVEQPMEQPVEDERIVNLERQCDDLKTMVEGYEGRIKAMEEIVASLGKPVEKQEAQEFGNNPNLPEQENSYANDTDSILNRPGMGGAHR